MNIDKLQFTQFGNRAILILWEDKMDVNILSEILYVKKNIEEIKLKEIVEVNNTYNSLIINYVFAINNIYDEISVLKDLLKKANIDKIYKGSKYIIPVCYHEKFSLDLEEVCAQKKLEVEEFISTHTTPIYTLYFMGFLPGFLYLGGLPKSLQISRKKTPRLRVEKGSVGIGEKQTGIYPQISAGGWQIIGNCPLTLFDASLEKPTPFSAGDQIKFKAVSLEEHQDILNKMELGEYRLEKVKEWE